MILSVLMLMSGPKFWTFAPRPPMGWNSWDCFATTVTEAQTLAQADVMAAKLKRFGWEYVVVDIQWYEPKASSFNYRADAELVMDGFGRLEPALNRFPSAKNDVGFRPLAESIHRRGLKFGIHLMRGIPRQAVAANLPIEGTSYHAADVADKGSTCPWNSDMYGVDMSKPGAQSYYDSVFAKIASWGVDFVKVDDIARPYHQAEIEAIRKAIDRTGRPIVLSLSPGETRLDAAEHVEQHANMWRISDDFWDNWGALLEQFERCRKWAPVTAAGHFPDADMLPLGKVRFGEDTHFTPVEQQTLLTLWAMFRSPLILGCDLTKLDEPTLKLITNPEVLAVNQHSREGRELWHRDGQVVWTARAEKGHDRYVALFNTSDKATEVSVDLSEVGFRGEVRVRDVWERKELGVKDKVSMTLPAHGSGLYLVRSAIR